MFKKMMLLAFAVGALVAFAAPAAASAHELTNESGETIEVGTTITGVSHNTVTTIPGTPPKDLACATVTIHGIVEVNNGSTVRVVDDEVGADTAEECHILITEPPGTVIKTIPVTVTPTFEELHLETGVGATNTAKFSFLVHIPLEGGGTLTCQYGPNSVGVSLTSGSNVIGAEGSVTSESANCDPKGTLHGTFALTVGAGTEKVIVD